MVNRVYRLCGSSSSRGWVVKIVIHIAEDFESKEVFYCDEQGIQSMGDMSLSDVPAQVPLAVVLPAQSVLLTTVKLPKVHGKRLQKALPFALEDQLASDINHLHFALAPEEKGADHAVAVLDKALLLTLLEEYEAAGLHPSVVTSDAFLLPDEVGAWSVQVRGRVAIVRTGQYQGFSVSTDTLDFTLQSLLSTLDDAALPQRINLYTEFTSIALSDVSAQYPDIQIVRGPLERELFSVAAIFDASINLLQGDCRPKIKRSRASRYWRVASMLALVLIVIMFAGHIAAYYHLRSENQVLTADIQQSYSRVYPGEPVVEPRYRMNAKLSRLLAQSRGNFYHSVLVKLGRVLRLHRDILLLAYRYDAGAMTVTMAVPTHSSATRFINALSRQHSLQVAVLHLNPAAKHFRLQLLLNKRVK